MLSYLVDWCIATSIRSTSAFSVSMASISTASSAFASHVCMATRQRVEQDNTASAPAFYCRTTVVSGQTATNCGYPAALHRASSTALFADSARLAAANVYKQQLALSAFSSTSSSSSSLDAATRVNAFTIMQAAAATRPSIRHRTVPLPVDIPVRAAPRRRTTTLEEHFQSSVASAPPTAASYASASSAATANTPYQLPMTASCS